MGLLTIFALFDGLSLQNLPFLYVKFEAILIMSEILEHDILFLWYRNFMNGYFSDSSETINTWMVGH